MAAAVNAVNDGMSVRRAAEENNVPKSTLSDRVTGKIKSGSVWGKKLRLSTAEEEGLVNAAIARTEKGIGFSKNSFMRFFGIFADENGIPFKNGRPSDMWWRNLKLRHPECSLRSPEPTAANRHTAMTRKRIQTYFKDLGEVLDKNQFDKTPERIWNMDETGIQMSHKPLKVIAAKGSRTVHGRASISRETITIIACVNASGRHIPPYFIMPGKTTKKLHGFDTESCRESTSPLFGAKFSVSETGWTKEGIARLWFSNHFVPNIGPSRPQLLIFDGHGSHNNTEFVKLAREENIILGELPSHTSHWTQPFDRSVFKSLKSSWHANVDEFVKNTGVSLSNSSFLRVFGKAWAACITPGNISSGFRATGIYPFNPSAIPELAYKPSQEEPEENSSVLDITDTLTVPETIATPCTPTGLQQEALADTQAKTTCIEIASTSGEPQRVTNFPRESTMDASPLFDLMVPRGETFIDLPLHITQEGLLTQMTNTDASEVTNELKTDLPESDIQAVSDEKALEVIESALSPETLLKYCAAFIGGVDIDDTIFSTWKMYKSKCSSKATSPKAIIGKHFPLPNIKIKTTKRKSESNRYFVISADEIYNEKVKKEEEKKQKEFEKEIRKIEREQKKQMRIDNIKTKKKATKAK